MPAVPTNYSNFKIGVFHTDFRDFHRVSNVTSLLDSHVCHGFQNEPKWQNGVF
jgi:hypothetical protein